MVCLAVQHTSTGLFLFKITAGHSRFKQLDFDLNFIVMVLSS
jgi:hypothetical protein